MRGVLIVVGLSIGCGSPMSDIDAGQDAGPAEFDSGGPDDAGIDAPIVETDAAPALDAFAVPDAPGTASIAGLVTRTADASWRDPPPDGRGNVYIFVYDA